MTDESNSLEAWEQRSSRTQAAAAHAYARLVHLAESRTSGQIRIVARFIASTYDGQTFPFDPFDLRQVDVEISDDMLLCLDALRWGRADLFRLIPDGDRRVRQLLDAWGIQWPEENKG